MLLDDKKNNSKVICGWRAVFVWLDLALDTDS